MEQLAELTKQVATLTAQVATFTTEKSTLFAENADLKSKVMKFEVDAKTAEEASKKVAIAAKRAEVISVLEDGVKSEAILPAQRMQYSKMLRIDDDVAVMAIDIADVKSLIPASKKTFGKEQGQQGGQQSTDLRPDQQVAKEIAELQAANSSLSFSAAQKVVFDRNPELAQSYAHANDKE